MVLPVDRFMRLNSRQRSRMLGENREGNRREQGEIDDVGKEVRAWDNTDEDPATPTRKRRPSAEDS